MHELYYIGLDVHKKSISFCIKTGDGTIVQRGQVAATRAALTAWASALERPWVGALEATLFTGWIHDHLQPFARELQVAHPAMLKAIACGKKKNDRLDATKISDLLRCDLLPRCYLAPPALRELRRVLRYRNLLLGRRWRPHDNEENLLFSVKRRNEEFHRRSAVSRAARRFSPVGDYARKFLGEFPGELLMRP